MDASECEMLTFINTAFSYKNRRLRVLSSSGSSSEKNSSFTFCTVLKALAMPYSIKVDPNTIRINLSYWLNRGENMR